MSCMVHLSHLYMLSFTKQVVITFIFCFDVKYQQAPLGCAMVHSMQTDQILLTINNNQSLNRVFVFVFVTCICFKEYNYMNQI